MDVKTRLKVGVPTPQNVDYSRIYYFNSNEFELNEIFNKYLINRGGRDDALEKHVGEIRDAILKEGDMCKFPPIVVDINTLQIEDGNCRFNAVLDIIERKLLDSITIRVIFEDTPADDFDNRVIQLNMGQKSWGILDFIYNYSKRGITSFTRLIDFCNDNETLHSSDGKRINPRYAAAALRKSTGDLKSPNLSITDAEIELGKIVVSEASEIRKKFSTDAKANGGGWYEPYLRAWSEFKVAENGLCNIPFETYLKEVDKTVKTRKREVQIPLGSNKKSDWNIFFRAIKTYVV